jgi:hypothetical protein
MIQRVPLPSYCYAIGSPPLASYPDRTALQPSPVPIRHIGTPLKNILSLKQWMRHSACAHNTAAVQLTWQTLNPTHLAVHKCGAKCDRRCCGPWCRRWSARIAAAAVDEKNPDPDPDPLRACVGAGSASAAEGLPAPPAVAAEPLPAADAAPVLLVDGLAGLSLRLLRLGGGVRISFLLIATTLGQFGKALIK